MSGARASKRNHSRNIITPGPSKFEFGLACLPLSPAQLRDVWDFDNKCASLMGAPLRTCLCVENDNTGGISDAELSCLKDTIQTMWEKARVLFEIFCDPKKPDLGYRIRVKPNVPIKLTFKGEDAFYFGWCAHSPAPAINPSSSTNPVSPCGHLYQRSPVDPLGYMGGPASYCNWAAGKQATAKLIRPTSSSARYLVRLECRNLSSGIELLWNYGSEKEMPIPCTWFQEQCCSVLDENKTKRQEKKNSLVPFINVEKCVLCGEAFSISNKEARVQRKPHFINNHADFLGSSWDALNRPYMQEEVDGLKLLLEADKLNSLIHILMKDLKWQIIPACTVLNSAEIEQYGDNFVALQEEFKKRCELLRASGTLVLRGMMAIDRVPNLTPQHLHPIRPSVWKTMSWSTKNAAPPSGLYGVPKNMQDEQTGEVQSAVLNFCLTCL